MATVDVGIVAPVVKGAWNNTAAYDRLNIVHSSDGATYQAVKAVPSGTALSNTEYWMQVTPKSIALGNVTEVSPGSAAASIGGTANAPTLNLAIPRGVAGNESIDDTAGEGDTDKVWSADKNYNSFRSAILQDNLIWNTLNPTSLDDRPIINGVQKITTSFDDTKRIMTIAEHGVRVTAQTNDTQPWIRFGLQTFGNGTFWGLEQNSYYTLSFDFECKVSGSMNINNFIEFAREGDVAWNELEYNRIITIQDQGVYTQHYSYTFYTDDWTKLVMTLQTNAAGQINIHEGDYFEIRNVILVKSRFESPWKPNPKDYIHELIDDSSGEEDYEKVWSADKSYGEFEKIKSTIYWEDSLFHTDWILGSISSSSGENTASTITVRNAGSYVFEDSVKAFIITPKEGFKWSGIIFDKSTNEYIGAITDNGDWIKTSQEIQINHDYKYRFCCRHMDDQTIVVSELPSDMFRITKINYTDKTLSISGIAADAEVVGQEIAHLKVFAQRKYYELDLDFAVKVQQLNRKTRISGSNFGPKPLVLIHFSDIHGDEQRLQNVIDINNYFSDYIDDVIHTGDTVKNYASDGINFWSNTDGSQKILNCIGNHDLRVSDDWFGLTMEQCYDSYFAPFISNWNVTYETGLTYYYKDYSVQNIRLIVLDFMHLTNDQLLWFRNLLNESLNEGKHVIIACHQRAWWKLARFDTPWDDDRSHATQDGSTIYSQYPDNLPIDYVNAVDSFLDNGGNFICWIHGHTHYKTFASIGDHERQLNISVANAGFKYANTYIWERVEGTKSEDDFNIIGIDTYSKILRIAKVGVNYDRYLRRVDTISYNYGTHQLIYSNQ